MSLCSRNHTSQFTWYTIYTDVSNIRLTKGDSNKKNTGSALTQTLITKLIKDGCFNKTIENKTRLILNVPHIISYAFLISHTLFYLYFFAFLIFHTFWFYLYFFAFLIFHTFGCIYSCLGVNIQCVFE